MADALTKRVAALEKAHGLGANAVEAKMIVYGTEITDSGLTACGQTWERQPSESGNALRKRALQELLSNNKRELIHKLCLHYVFLMERTVNGSRYCKENRTT